MKSEMLLAVQRDLEVKHNTHTHTHMDRHTTHTNIHRTCKMTDKNKMYV